MPDALKGVDLFCGCGGMSRGFENAGFDIVAGFDIQITYMKRDV